MNTLIRDGQVVRPIIGVTYLDASQASLLGIRKGVLVLFVVKDSPAELAGVKGTARGSSGSVVLGDVIVGIDDDVVDKEADLFQALEHHKVFT